MNGDGNLSNFNIDVIFLFSAFLLIIVALLKIVYFVKFRALDFYLMLVMLSLLNLVTVVYLSLTGKLSDWACYYRTGGLSNYIFVPATFLVTQKALKGTDFKWRDLLFFLPALIFLIDFSSFFLLPTEAKRLIFLKDIKDDAIMEFRQAIFFKGIFHYVFVNLYGVVLAIWQIFMISNLVKKGGKSFYTENRGMVLWFYVWAGLILFISLPDVIYGVFDYDVNLKRLIYVIPCLIAYPVFPISLFLSPALLYGTKGIWIEPLSAVQEDNLVFDEIKLESIKQNDDIKDVSPPVSGKKVYYKIEDAEILMNKIDQYMSSKKPYLNSEYAINDMAADLGFNVRQVSSLLNDYKGVSFKDYINGFRIEEFLRIHLNKKNSEKLTLEGLAINCGFANRFTFINAFKKMKGKTPSEYFDKDFQ